MRTLAHFVQCLPVGVGLMFSSWLDWVSRFGVGENTVVEYHHHTISTGLNSVDVNLDHLVNVVVKLLHGQISLLLLPFHTVLLGERV
jgi:hypothetical protein